MPEASTGQDSRSRVLIITHEPLRGNLSGPGVRALEMARRLSGRHQVTLATPFPPEIADPGCTIATYSFDGPHALMTIAAGVHVVVVQGFTLSQFPFLAQMNVPIVVDLYCPFTIEHLEMITSRPGAAAAFGCAGMAGADASAASAMEVDAAGVLAVQNTQLVLGDFFLCASERQRDFWIGALHTAGRINPRTYAADPTLRSLIDVVPFGVTEPREDRDARPVLKGVRPGIGANDHVLLWAGSILDWQDPQTLVRAVASIAGRRPDVKLFFMGTRHPNPVVAPMRAVTESIDLARELGVLDTHVIFNDWVPYTERWQYLHEADLGLSTHREHLETRLSFRTRMLDYLWSGLPIVCTEGDVFAELVAKRGLGAVVPPGDVEALASAIERLIDDGDEHARCRTRLLEVAEEFRWQRVIAPLARFCAAPHVAADRVSTTVQRAEQVTLTHAFRVNRWLKRKAVALGISAAWIDQIKTLGPVRTVLGWINRLTMAYDRRDAAPPS